VWYCMNDSQVCTIDGMWYCMNDSQVYCCWWVTLGVLDYYQCVIVEQTKLGQVIDCKPDWRD